MQRECLFTMCLQGNLLCNENVFLQCIYMETCYATRMFVYKETCYATRMFVYNVFTRKPVMQRECLFTMYLHGNLLCNENVCLQCVYKETFYATRMFVYSVFKRKPVMQRECLFTMCLQGNLLCNENVCLQCVYKGTCYATRMFVYNVCTREPVIQRECLFTVCVQLQENLQFGLYLNHELRFFFSLSKFIIFNLKTRRSI